MSHKRRVVLRVIEALLAVCALSVLITYLVLYPARAAGPGPQRGAGVEPGSGAALPNTATAYCDGVVFRCVCDPAGTSMEASMATLALNPDRGAPGQAIGVAGRGFASGTSLALRLGVPNAGLSKENLAVAIADAQGQFAVELVLPGEWPGAGTPIVERELVIAAVDETMGQALAFASFTNEASSDGDGTD